MEFAKRTYRMIDRGFNRAISIETINAGNTLKITLEQDCYPTGSNKVSIDIPEEIARAIRDNINIYLNDKEV